MRQYRPIRNESQDFIELSRLLDESYVIVLVGLTEKQIRNLPKEIKGLTRTNSAKELAALYTMANIYVNPSKEETFGMTTIEAQACGTDAIVYEDTACEEVVRIHGGVAVKPDVMELYKAITGTKNTVGGANILFLPRTSSAYELAGIYTAADVFVNPTHEDNYPTTNLEAQACGTKVITYDVGGSKETLK